MGSIIGAGFFLGTGVSISLDGPTIIVGYVLGGIIAGIVFGALAEMSVHDPQQGSLIILASHISLGKKVNRDEQAYMMRGFPYTSFTGIFLIVAVLAGALLRPVQRGGMIISLVLFLSVIIAYELAGSKE